MAGNWINCSMSITTEFNQKRGYVHHVFGGVISEDDIISAFDNTIVLTELKPDTPVIWEFRKVEIANIADIVNKIRGIAGYIKSKLASRKSGHKVALVSEYDLIYGMARMYQAIADFLPVELRVFRDFKTAEDWVRK